MRPYTGELAAFLPLMVELALPTVKLGFRCRLFSSVAISSGFGEADSATNRAGHSPDNLQPSREPVEGLGAAKGMAAGV